MSSVFSTRAPKAPTPIAPEKPQAAALSLSPTTQAFETERKRKGLLSTFLGGNLENATNINRRIGLANVIGGGAAAPSIMNALSQRDSARVNQHDVHFRYTPTVSQVIGTTVRR